MEFTTLGNTGLKVSRLGAGLVEIGNQLTFGEVDQAAQVLNTALDNGITFFDTAECYGISEELIGRTVAHRRHEFVLATKAGHVAGGYSGTPWTGKTVADSIDRSLKRMKTDHLDLVQLHAYDLTAPAPDDVVEALFRARDDGKTRFVGYSADNEHGERAVESGLYDTIQTVFSVADQKARKRLFGLAEDRGMGVIIKRPIANASWGATSRPPIYDEDGVADELVIRARAMSDLGPIPGAPDDRIALSLGFVLAHPEVDTAIVGTRNPAHMKSNIEKTETELPIPLEVVAEIRRRFDEIGSDWPQID